MNALIALLALVTSITPSRSWYPPSVPLSVDVKSEVDAQLVLTDFAGQAIKPAHPTDFKGDKTVNLKSEFPALNRSGTYVLFVVPKDKPTAEFIGTPLVLEVRQDRRPGMPNTPEVTKVQPLEYAVMTTDAGAMTMTFWYDVAPLTVESYLELSRKGFYDGLTFHRIIKDFVLQGGDPKGDGTGGPGYHVEAEFNPRQHLPGVLSMARNGDPNESADSPPRHEFANSAGSQFFICLNYDRTQHLDGRYTAFGKVVSGLDVMKKLEATPLMDENSGRPENPPVIRKVEVKPVTAAENPYAELLNMKPAAAPAPAPAK